MTHRGMKYGIFLAPFHRVGENPTLAIDRDMELIEWLDYLGYDEVWIGEHHSAGWELIASNESRIAAAAQRTRHIMLGSGVTSLPYHHPFLVAQRFVQLDHLTRGRAMLGCGPGALVSDAYMMGIEPVTQRQRMDEALDAIMALLRCDEPVTMKTDWFELRDARLHLAPYTDPYFPISVASVMTPAGMISAGKHGLGVLSLGAGLPGGPEAIAEHWRLGEDTAAKHGTTMDRGKWRLVVNVHVADDDELALRQVHAGERHETVTYFEETLGRPPGRGRRHHARGHARHREQGYRAAGRPLARGLRRTALPRQRVGESGRDAQELRALRALCDAAVPGLARHRGRIQSVVPGQAENHLWSQRGGDSQGLHGRRQARSQGIHGAHRGRRRRLAGRGLSV